MREKVKSVLAGILLALTIAFPAAADTVLRADDGADSIRLFEDKCVNKKILAHVPPQFRSDMQTGESKIDSKTYVTCWFLLDDGYFLLIYEDGDVGRWPQHLFRIETKV